MRFVDASVFVHAFLKPKRKLKPNEVEIKEAAKAIVRRINEGEEVGLTVVQLAEIANILEKYMPLEKAQQVERFLLYAPNVKVYGVEENICLKALDVAEEKEIGLSDAIAYVVMLQHNVREIYSFDRDFDKLEGIVRVR
ncbi:MAG: type II toxin-antitoxin system VapC family toxin [Thermoproteales archaeon]|nr:type II toxin-antitoxin system VapC family toxin [Thermoproteales archaeon]